MTAVTAPERDDLAGFPGRARSSSPDPVHRAAWRECRLFVPAIVVLAVHGIDDSFLQPQPGTSAGDHLVGGLVPLAVLALAAWAYPRLRGGRRGALALVFGVFGIVAGAEAVHYTSQVGASGDDYSGLLAVPAGLVLLGLGAVTLWTTRRRGAIVRGATCAACCSAPWASPLRCSSSRR